MEGPKQNYLLAAKRILHYIKGTLGHGIFFKCSKNHDLIGYADSDFAHDVEDRKSISGYGFTKVQVLCLGSS